MSSDEGEKEVTFFTYAASPFGNRTYWTLVSKNIPFKLVYVNTFTKEELDFTGKEFNARTIPAVMVKNDDGWSEDDEAPFVEGTNKTCKWMDDSTSIAVWLDKLFPANSLLPTEEQNQVSKKEILDFEKGFVDETLFASFFFLMTQNEEFFKSLDLAWDYSSMINKTSGGVPAIIRPFWGLILRFSDRTKFIQTEGEKVKQKYGSLKGMKDGIVEDLLEYLGEGPFFFERDRATLNDISVYAFVYMVEGSGLIGEEEFFHKFSNKTLRGGKLRVWLERMEELLGPGLQQAPPLYPQNIAKRSVLLPSQIK